MQLDGWMVIVRLILLVGIGGKCDDSLMIPAGAVVGSADSSVRT